ncbi:MAG: hypothetical protein BWY06_03297 [Candidatus Latescibacteria bacterium ADurb.Bin168]|nr:MAG: hypothetical protein BWY06_03297 [Candidatus Latescibacteria bacterium ADurb.Bin168]
MSGAPEGASRCSSGTTRARQAATPFRGNCRPDPRSSSCDVPRRILPARRLRSRPSIGCGRRSQGNRVLRRSTRCPRSPRACPGIPHTSQSRASGRLPQEPLRTGQGPEQSRQVATLAPFVTPQHLLPQDANMPDCAASRQNPDSGLIIPWRASEPCRIVPVNRPENPPSGRTLLGEANQPTRFRCHARPFAQCVSRPTHNLHERCRPY